MRYACALLLPLLLAATVNVRADEVSDAARAKLFRQLPFAESEFDSAKALTDRLSPGERELHNALRYLVRPDFEDELFRGVGRPGCYLPALKSRVPARLDIEETLRLWAVVNSGLLAGNDVPKYVAALSRAQVPDPGSSLAHSAIILMTIRALIRSGRVQGADGLLELAGEVIKSTEKAPGSTSGRSKRVTREQIEPQWFANHFWRAVIARAAHDLGFSQKARAWQTDLGVLGKVWRRKTGWASMTAVRVSASLDLYPNLLALASLRMAATAPDGLLKERVRTLARTRLEKRGPAILRRLEKTYGAEGLLIGSRLILTLPISTEIAPGGKEKAEGWRIQLLAGDPKGPSSGGGILGGAELFDVMGIAQAGGTNWAYRETLETSLAVIGYCGGVFGREARPLAADRAAAGRVLYSLSILQRVRDALKPADRNNPAVDSRVRAVLNDRAAKAIILGSDYLKSQMNDDGNFGDATTGSGRMRVGLPALCLLAILHSGEDRNSRVAKRGMKYIESDLGLGDRGRVVGTYTIGLILAIYQIWYEREQKATGILKATNPRSYRIAAKAMWRRIPEARQSIIKKLMLLLDLAKVDGGGWGYRADSSKWDNSCSQYAIMGYKSASLLGFEIKDRFWLDEANRLVAQYTLVKATGRESDISRVYRTPDQMRAGQTAPGAGGEDEPRPANKKKSRKTSARKKSKKKHPKSPSTSADVRVHAGGWGYRSGPVRSNMGMIASGVQGLAVCLDELKIRGALSAKLERSIRYRIFGGLDAIGTLYRTLRDSRSSRARAGMRRRRMVSSSLYSYYAIERAGVMSGYELLPGGIDWYFVGATLICDSQDLRRGSWGVPNRRGGSALLSTAYAILFLKKRGLPIPTLRKPPPEPEPKPKNPITRGPGKKYTKGASAEK